MPTFLLDQMLPARLCTSLADTLGDIQHVKQTGLSEADDAEVFAYARDRGHTIVTKDADFQSLLALHGPPPRVLWLRIGNASTDTVEHVLRSHADDIWDFHQSDGACLIITS